MKGSKYSVDSLEEDLNSNLNVQAVPQNAKLYQFMMSLYEMYNDVCGLLA